MNKHLHEQLDTYGHEFSLRPEEKNHMREQVYAAVAYNPIRSTRAIVRFWSLHRTSAVFASALSVVLIMTGTVFASQNSVPGELLYPLKINIAEPLALATAISPSQKAQTEADFAERRIEEAEQLAARGALTPTVATSLQENFSQHSSHALALMSAIATQDKTEGAQLSTQLNASLSAHAEVLTQLADRQHNEATKEASRAVVATIAQHADALASLQLSTTPTDEAPAASSVVAVATEAPAPAFARSASITATDVTGAPASTTASSEPRVARSAMVRKNNDYGNRVFIQAQMPTSTIPQADIDALRSGAESQLSAAESDLEGADASTSQQASLRIAAIKALIASASSTQSSPDEAGLKYQKALEESVFLRTHLNAQKQFKELLPELMTPADQHGDGSDN